MDMYNEEPYIVCGQTRNAQTWRFLLSFVLLIQEHFITKSTISFTILYRLTARALAIFKGMRVGTIYFGTLVYSKMLQLTLTRPRSRPRGGRDAQWAGGKREVRVRLFYVVW